MRVYKFINVRYGLRAIRERRLKISEIHTLNDAFDLIPFDLSDPKIREAVIHSRHEIGKKGGILCFSRFWHNPVLWAHYADCHKGLAVGFDVPDLTAEMAQLVEYVEQPMKLTLDNLDFELANKMLFMKYDHWRYEDEIRMWSSLEEKSGHFYFMKFGPMLRLAEVIVGAKSSVTERKILQTLNIQNSDVRILKARLAYNAFRVVEDENGFSGTDAKAAVSA
jgi:hypothetical protein